MYKLEAPHNTINISNTELAEIDYIDSSDSEAVEIIAKENHKPWLIFLFIMLISTSCVSFGKNVTYDIPILATQNPYTRSYNRSTMSQNRIKPLPTPNGPVLIGYKLLLES